MIRRPLAIWLLLPLTACATRFQHYDFAAARLPGGGYDTAKLIAELKASGANGLRDGSWFPLIHLERTEFAPTSANLPDGYVLTTVSASGTSRSAIPTRYALRSRSQTKQAFNLPKVESRRTPKRTAPKKSMICSSKAPVLQTERHSPRSQSAQSSKTRLR